MVSSMKVDLWTSTAAQSMRNAKSSSLIVKVLREFAEIVRVKVLEEKDRSVHEAITR